MRKKLAPPAVQRIHDALQLGDPSGETMLAWRVKEAIRDLYQQVDEHAARKHVTELTRITTLDEAAAWGVQLHEFSTIYREWMNEKTMIKDPKTGAWTRVWTHHNVRKAYNSLNHLWRSEMLFVYLNPPAGVLAPERIKSTTNSLEGGINAQLKLLARTHRGRSGERQRRMLDWWLYLKTELPDDPVRIARQSDWGQGQLAKVSTLT